MSWGLGLSGRHILLNRFSLRITSASEDVTLPMACHSTPPLLRKQTLSSKLSFLQAYGICAGFRLLGSKLRWFIVMVFTSFAPLIQRRLFYFILFSGSKFRTHGVRKYASPIVPVSIWNILPRFGKHTEQLCQSDHSRLGWLSPPLILGVKYYTWAKLKAFQCLQSMVLGNPPNIHCPSGFERTRQHAVCVFLVWLIHRAGHHVGATGKISM